MKRLALLVAVLLITSPVFGSDTYIDGYSYEEFDILGFTGMAAPSVSASGKARIYYDSTANSLKLSQNGGAYADIATGATGYTNLTSFVDQTAWRVFYSDTNGDVTELALGADGTYLRSNGAAAAPTFTTPAGSGDLLADGTVPMTANWDIGNFDITLKALTGDGTIEGATLTEGGNAVSNDTEIEAVVEPLIDTLANLTSVGGQPIAFADAGTDAFFGWDDVGGAQYENLTAAEAMTIIGGAATDLDGSGNVAWGNITAGELADNTVDSDDFVHEDWGEVTNASGSVVIDDSVAVTSWNLTTPTITTSLTTDGKTISEAEIGRLDGLAGIIVTDVTACADLEGRSLTIAASTLNADAELYTDTKGIYFEDPIATDDFKSIWFAKQACVITSIWAESDQTVTFMLQKDDGSPADLDTVDLAPAAGVAEDVALDGDATFAAGDRLDLAITSVSGTPTWVSIHWTFAYSD